MCGRAKLPDDVSEIKLDLKIDWDETGDYRPSWNAAPTSQLPVVVSSNGERTLRRYAAVAPVAGDRYSPAPAENRGLPAVGPRHRITAETIGKCGSSDPKKAGKD
jgi:putative SOS response-associated peptidase YedK